MQNGSRVSLRTWIWRAFVQTALIPLILVETVLISVYLLTNVSIRDAQISHLRSTALSQKSLRSRQTTGSSRARSTTMATSWTRSSLPPSQFLPVR